MIPEIGDVIEHSPSLTRFIVASRYKDRAGAVFLRDHPRDGTGEIFPANECGPVTLDDLTDLESFEISVGGKAMEFAVSRRSDKHRFSCGNVHIDIPAEDVSLAASALARMFQGAVVQGLSQQDLDSLLRPSVSADAA